MRDVVRTDAEGPAAYDITGRVQFTGFGTMITDLIVAGAFTVIGFGYVSTVVFVDGFEGSILVFFVIGLFVVFLVSWFTGVLCNIGIVEVFAVPFVPSVDDGLKVSANSRKSEVLAGTQLAPGRFLGLDAFAPVRLVPYVTRAAPGTRLYLPSHGARIFALAKQQTLDLIKKVDPRVVAAVGA